LKLDYFILRRSNHGKNKKGNTMPPYHLAHDLDMIVKRKKCDNPDCKRFDHMGGCNE